MGKWTAVLAAAMMLTAGAAAAGGQIVQETAKPVAGSATMPVYVARSVVPRPRAGTLLMLGLLAGIRRRRATIA